MIARYMIDMELTHIHSQIKEKKKKINFINNQ